MSPKPCQLQFVALKDFTETRHGSDLRRGRRKTARPIAIKRPMHLVLRASKAAGPLTMLKPVRAELISSVVVRFSEKYSVRVLRFANVGNHLHLVIQAKNRAGFKAFLRTITGLIARIVTGAARGRAFGKFWNELAFSRVLNWGRDAKAALKYVLGNALEGVGVPTTRKGATNFRGAVFGFGGTGFS